METVEVVATLVGYGVGLGIVLTTAIWVVIGSLLLVKNTIGRWWPEVFL